MEQIKVEVTGELPFEFEGKEIFGENNSWKNGVDRNRYHSIHIFSLEDSFVCQIGFVSHWQGEPAYFVANEFDEIEEIAEYIQNYNPTQYLIGYPKGDHFKEKQEALITSLTRDWLDLKIETLTFLGVKRPNRLKRGQPAHPLGPCKNPGWSIPQTIIDAIAEKAATSGQTPSQIVVSILSAPRRTPSRLSPSSTN